MYLQCYINDKGEKHCSGIEIPNNFERPEYEALAEKKRKALADSQRLVFPTAPVVERGPEILQFNEQTVTVQRREPSVMVLTSRIATLAWRGSSNSCLLVADESLERQGSKKEVAPEIQKRFGEALLLHAHGRDDEVKGKRKRWVPLELQRNKRRRRPRDAQDSQLRGGPTKWRKIRATLNETKRIRERAAIKARKEDICSESEGEAIKDEEYHGLFVDLCKALASLQRYWEALEIVNLARRLDANMLPVEKKKELQSLGAKISCDTMDPKQWFDCVRSVIQQHPYRLNAWNCYYKVISRLGKRASAEAKFMHHLRSKYRDCVPPILIAGHHFTVASRHQDAAREYLEAYKLMPDSPLINLCVGAALIN